MQRAGIQQEMEQARLDFHELVKRASAEDLSRRTAGTRWTNRQLLFHMVFGYLIVRTLLPLVGRFGRLPLSCSRHFSAVLQAFRGPYNLNNSLGSCLGGWLLTPPTMVTLMDRTTLALQRGLDRETAETLALTMAFPTSWDPYFTETMSVLDVYRFGTQHFRHHQSQLTL